MFRQCRSNEGVRKSDRGTFSGVGQRFESVARYRENTAEEMGSIRTTIEDFTMRQQQQQQQTETVMQSLMAELVSLKKNTGRKTRDTTTATRSSEDADATATTATITSATDADATATITSATSGDATSAIPATGDTTEYSA